MKVHFILSICMLTVTSVVFAETALTASSDITVENLSPESATISDRTDRILRQMSSYLSGAKEFSFSAFVAYDTLSETSQIIQYGGVVEVFVRRPGSLFAEFDGDERHTRIFVSDSNLNMIDMRKQLYSVTPTLPHIDDALDAIFEKYGITLPISDFVYSNPYKILLENVQKGTFIGTHKIDGISAHHLAFSQEIIDWQLWIKDGPMPVPLKLVIDYKTAPGTPRYTARFSEWDFSPYISKQFFDFHPPSGASEISVLPVQGMGVEE